MRKVVHRLTGYYPRTDVMAFKFDIPMTHIREVRRLANIGHDDPQLMDSYHLTIKIAKRIAVLIEKDLPQGFLYYVEPFYVPVRA
jgi:hypothetical protein